MLSCGLIFDANSLFHQQIKKQAAEIFDDLDLNISISINIFISEKHNWRKFTFEIENPIYSEANQIELNRHFKACLIIRISMLMNFQIIEIDKWHRLNF